MRNGLCLKGIIIMSKSKRKSKRIESELMPDEEILWQGRPILSKLLTTQDIFLIPFSLLWCSMFIHYLIVDTLQRTLIAINSPFGWVCLYFLFGRFIVRFIRKKYTIYAVTTNRVLILNNLFGRHIQTFRLNRLPMLEKIVRRNGVGSIIFDEPMPTPWWRKDGKNYLKEFGSEVPGFYDIWNVEEVYQLISELNYNLTPIKVEKHKRARLPD